MQTTLVNHPWQTWLHLRFAFWRQERPVHRLGLEQRGGLHVHCDAAAAVACTEDGAAAAPAAAGALFLMTCSTRGCAHKLPPRSLPTLPAPLPRELQEPLTLTLTCCGAEAAQAAPKCC